MLFILNHLLENLNIVHCGLSIKRLNLVKEF